MPQLLFFATTEDLQVVLAAVDRRESRVAYALMGQFEHEEVQVLADAKGLPDLGLADKPTGASCRSFLAFEAATPVRARPIDRTDGMRRYAVDQLVNPDTVTLTPAGAWRVRMLLQGRLATVSRTATAATLFKRFRAAFKGRCTPVRGVWVGADALGLLDSGYRLTIAEQAPRELDLTR